MRIVMFYHSLLSDWNHGNAHFLRGVVSELLSRGHQVRVYEPVDAWSLKNLVSEHGLSPIRWFRNAYPGLDSVRYDLKTLDLDKALDGADLAIVHEWNDHDLVKRIGRHRAQSRSYRLLFHDTHHRSVTDRKNMASYDLSHYDGTLAFGKVIRDLYLSLGWTSRAWTWHEAADTRIFRPLPHSGFEGDLVWIGNWGDEERSIELREFLIDPVRDLRLKARIYGVRYPDEALKALKSVGIDYGGWLPNYEAPRQFSRFRATVHIPRRPYAQALPGIPTIRVFEALACGIPLVSAPWDDTEGLFTPDRDFLTARSGEEMKKRLRTVIHDREASQQLAAHGLRTIREHHTCAHRVDQLIGIYKELQGVNRWPRV